MTADYRHMYYILCNAASKALDAMPEGAEDSAAAAEILRQAKCEIRVETDPDRMRPSDVPVIAADIGRLFETTGWKPEIPLEQTIGDVLDYWRNRNQENVE